MSVKQRRIRWTGPMVFVVLETQRRVQPHLTRAIPPYTDEDGVEQPGWPAEPMFQGFDSSGYGGSSERTDATDRLIAKALNLFSDVYAWTPAELVIWAFSTRGRHFFGYDFEDAGQVCDYLSDQHAIVREWLVADQGPAIGAEEASVA